MNVLFFRVDGKNYSFLILMYGKMAHGKNSGSKWEEFVLFFSFFLYKLWGGSREITKAFQYLGGKDTVQLLISRYKAVEIVF